MPDTAPVDGGEPKAPRSKARTAVLVLLGAAGVVAIVTLVLLRAMDGPLVLENRGTGTVAAAEVGERSAVTVTVAMPKDVPATIKAVHTRVEGGLKIEDALLWRRDPSDRDAFVAVDRWPLSGAGAPKGDALKEPGNFKMSEAGRSPSGQTMISVVLRPTAEGLHRVRSIEVDYTRGLRRHRKSFKVGFGLCANPAGTKTPAASFCKGAPTD